MYYYMFKPKPLSICHYKIDCVVWICSINHTELLPIPNPTAANVNQGCFRVSFTPQTCPKYYSKLWTNVGGQLRMLCHSEMHGTMTNRILPYLACMREISTRRVKILKWPTFHQN